MRSRRRIDHVHRAHCSSGRDLVSTLLVGARKGRNLRRIRCNAICRLLALLRRPPTSALTLFRETQTSAGGLNIAIYEYSPGLRERETAVARCVRGTDVMEYL